jgi:hypothetical protein
VYDPRTWRRRPISLPTGRAFASSAGAAEPVFSPSGRRGALRTENGVMVFEPAP